MYLQACDLLSQARGLNYTYDGANLYHSLEYLQHDYAQLGQYKRADEVVARLRNIVSRIHDSSSDTSNLWGKWSSMRSEFRQSYEVYKSDQTVSNPINISQGVCPKFGQKYNFLPPESYIPENYQGNLEFMVTSEAGALLMTGEKYG